MSVFDIRIETLPPMRVAYFKAFSQHPEMEASGTLWACSEQVGIMINQNSVRRVGFNNPPPWDTPDPAYGCKSWITIPADINQAGEIRVKRFPGSLCAVTSIEKLAGIGAVWEHLYNWSRAVRSTNTPTWTDWSNSSARWTLQKSVSNSICGCRSGKSEILFSW